MNVFLVGANGFIGRHLEKALIAANFQVRRGVHSLVSSTNDIPIDFCRDLAVSDWLSRLQGIDVVINCVGIIRETATQQFATLHTQAPQALFAACAQTQVKKVIQISALGADEYATSQYHLSKKMADDFLASLDINWVIVQPSLVYGDDGISSEMFRTLASLPIIPLPGKGHQQLQPLHIDDLCAAIVKLLNSEQFRSARIPFVGSEPISYRTMLANYRRQLGLAETCFLPIPFACMQWLAKITQWLPNNPLTPETLSMLERGNTANTEVISQLLGHPPRSLADFITPQAATTLRLLAQLNWLLALTQISLAIIWLASGIVSLGIYPTTSSFELLYKIGLTGHLATLSLYGLAILDIILGLLTWLRPSSKLWKFQLALVFGYSLVVALCLPEFLVHPFMPVVKNLAILVNLTFLLTLEK